MAQFGYDEDPSDASAVNATAYAGIPPRNNDAALFVGGLSFSATEDDLRNAFGFVGTIVSVRIVQDRDTGKPRGFAFVNFETPESVDAAIRDCQGMELCGRNVRLDRSAAGIVGRGFKGGKPANYIPAPGYHHPHHPAHHPAHHGVPPPPDFFMYNGGAPGGGRPAFIPMHPAAAAYAYPGFHPYAQMPPPQGQSSNGNSETNGNGGVPPPPPAMHPGPFMMGYPPMMMPPPPVPNGYGHQSVAPPPPPPAPQKEQGEAAVGDNEAAGGHGRH